MIDFVLLSGYSIWLTKNKFKHDKYLCRVKCFGFCIAISEAKSHKTQSNSEPSWLLPSISIDFTLRGLSSKEYHSTWDTGLCAIFAGCVMAKPCCHSCLGTRAVPGPLGIASARLRRKTSQFFSPVWLDQAALSYFSVRSHCFREGKAWGWD